MGLSRPGLARDVIRLLIAALRLITAILTFVSGATNYARRCSAPTFTSSSCRMGARYSSLRYLAGKPAQWCMRISGAGGGHPTTFTISAAAGTSPP